MSRRAGGVDWDARFRAMALEGDEVEVGDRWERRAARFDRWTRSHGDPAASAIAAQLRPDDVVLDVGAGTGRHVAAFAPRCREVVAVEPSAAMRARLAARCAEVAVTNVRVVEAAFPCPTPAVDVAFSAHVLYGVTDAAAFLTAMTKTARRLCVLVLGVVAPADALRPLAARVLGRARPPRPAALEALALLHQLGFAASLEVVPDTARELSFTDGEEDLAELAGRLGLATDEPARSQVGAALREVGRPVDGRFVLGETGPHARITWPGQR